MNTNKQNKQTNKPISKKYNAKMKLLQFLSFQQFNVWTGMGLFYSVRKLNSVVMMEIVSGLLTGAMTSQTAKTILMKLIVIYLKLMRTTTG